MSGGYFTNDTFLRTRLCFHCTDSNAQHPYGLGWVSIASSADGSNLAVGTGRWDFGQYADGGALYTSKSSGGFNWTRAATLPNFLALASSADGLKLAATMGYGGLHTSTDGGSSWTKSPASDAEIIGNYGCVRLHWETIASSSDGSKLVAATGYGDTCGRYLNLYTSTDSGATWAVAPSSSPWNPGTVNDFYGLASSSDGTKFVAVNNLNGIYVTTNSGASWAKTSAPAHNWKSVASSSDGLRLVAGIYPGHSGSGIYLSTNGGASWNKTTAPDGPGIIWGGIASSADGSQLAAASCTDGVYTSTDGGASWSKTSSPSSACIIASSDDGTRLVTAGSGGVYTSNDGGAHWSTVLI